jgi:hypothetical protein
MWNALRIYTSKKVQKEEEREMPIDRTTLEVNDLPRIVDAKIIGVFQGAQDRGKGIPRSLDSQLLPFELKSTTANLYKLLVSILFSSHDIRVPPSFSTFYLPNLPFFGLNPSLNTMGGCLLKDSIVSIEAYDFYHIDDIVKVDAVFEEEAMKVLKRMLKFRLFLLLFLLLFPSHQPSLSSSSPS